MQIRMFQRQHDCPTLYGALGRPLHRPILYEGLAFSLFTFFWYVFVVVTGLLPLYIALDFWHVGLQGVLVWVVFIVNWLGFSGAIGTLLLAYLKRLSASQRFSIVLLRPFGLESTSYSLLNVVAPTLGCYGSVSLANDASYAQMVKLSGTMKMPERTKVNLAFAIANPDEVLKLSNDDWIPTIQATIWQADLVVVDLSIPSPNLVLEMMFCASCLPPHRLVIVGERGTPWDEFLPVVRKTLETYRESGDLRLTPKLPEPIEYDKYFPIWRFRYRIWRAMRTIARLEYAAAINGTWPTDAWRGFEQWFFCNLMVRSEIKRSDIENAIILINKAPSLTVEEKAHTVSELQRRLILY
jgi:hypothetical protein